MASETTSGGFVVFGATGSVGEQLARRLSAAGRPVLLAGRNGARLGRLAEELDAPRAAVEAGDSGSIDAAVELAKQSFGGVAGVANCIGSLLLKPAHSTTDDQWRETIEANLFSAFAVTRAGAKVMRSNGGAIALVSSAAAQLGLANHEAIAAAKAGIEGLVRAAAASYASRGIRVNAIAPGLVKSNMSRHLWESASAAANSNEMHALGRLGEPDDVARALEWLLDRENNWITGQILGVDGGLARVMPRRVVRK